MGAVTSPAGPFEKIPLRAARFPHSTTTTPCICGCGVQWYE